MALRKAIPLVLALLTAGGSLRAQEYSIRSFGAAEGLTNLVIRRIYEDGVGFLWVSTENGLFRYDGGRFEPFGPAQGIPASFAAALGGAPDGSLLAGGTFGLYRLFGNRFEKLVTPFKTVSTLQGIQSDGKGHTFLATDAGLVELDSSPGKHDFAIRSFPQPPGTSGAQANGVFIDGMRSGTVAGWNSAEWMFEGLESFRETADFRPIRLWPSRKTAPEISG